MSAFSRFEKFKPEVIQVEVEDWGGEIVHIKGMDAAGMEDFFKIKSDDGEQYSARRSAEIVVLHLCNPDGTPLIPVDEREDAVRELCGHKLSVLGQLVSECLKASGLSQAAIEEAAKN